MKSTALVFSNLETLGRFVKSVETGYYINTAQLTVKGTFPMYTIEKAVEELGAQEVASASTHPAKPPAEQF